MKSGAFGWRSREAHVWRAALLFLMTAGATACRTDRLTTDTPPRNVGDSARGSTLLETYGCGSCHTIKDVPGANGVVGPPLDGFARRVYVAGMLRNTPDNLIRWIEDPQAIVPGNAMPRLGIGDRDAKDIAAFLYTLN